MVFSASDVYMRDLLHGAYSSCQLLGGGGGATATIDDRELDNYENNTLASK